MPVELKVPEVGESINEVLIGDWLKSEGEHVERDEEVVVIETDKATLEVAAPESGTLTRVLKRTGDKASVGDVIGYLEPGAGTQAQPERRAGQAEERRSSANESAEVQEGAGGLAERESKGEQERAKSERGDTSGEISRPERGRRVAAQENQTEQRPVARGEERGKEAVRESRLESETITSSSFLSANGESQAEEDRPPTGARDLQSGGEGEETHSAGRESARRSRRVLFFRQMENLRPR